MGDMMRHRLVRNNVTAILGFVLAAIVLVTRPAMAANEIMLATKSGCIACHMGVAKKIGPPFVDVAKKYAGQKDAGAVLADYIVKGTGPTGHGWDKAGKASLPSMPANAGLSQQDAVKLANWILGLKGEIFDPAKLVSTSVKVTGAVKNKLVLSIDDLKELPIQQIGETPIVCESGALMSTVNSARGVLLSDILTKATIAVRDNGDLRKMAIIATASDGYKAVFSWNEVFNSPIGEGILVLFERNGLPLTDDEGRIAMISTKDTRTGPRHVNWLTSIEIRKITN